MNEPLKNPKHERFCLLVAGGENTTDAYKKVFKCPYNSARANGARLIAKDSLKQRIRGLKLATSTAHTLTMQERREHFAKVVRCDLTKFKPEKDGIIVEEITTVDGVKHYKIPSKRLCIMDDAKLAGDLIDKSDLSTNGEALPSVLPNIVINVPKAWVTRRTGPK